MRVLRKSRANRAPNFTMTGKISAQVRFHAEKTRKQPQWGATNRSLRVSSPLRNVSTELRITFTASAKYFA